VVNVLRVYLLITLRVQGGYLEVGLEKTGKFALITTVVWSLSSK